MDRAWGAVVAVALSGCAIENGIYYPHETDVFYQSPTDEVDILFVVDDSNSMQQEQEALSDGFETFLAEVEASSTSYHIGMVSTSLDPSDPSPGQLVGDPPFLTRDDDVVKGFQSRVLLGTEGSDQEKGLQAAVEAVWRNDGFVRIDANLVVIFVTDEDDCSDDGRLAGQRAYECYAQRSQLVPVGDMVERIRSVKRAGETVRFGGILGPMDFGCEDAYPGTRYARAIYETGGTIGRICDKDWTPALSALGVVALGILDQFTLSRPADEDTIAVFVDEVEVPESPDNGWTYDWRNQLLSFHGASVPERGSEIRVEYDVAPAPAG